MDLVAELLLLLLQELLESDRVRSMLVPILGSWYCSILGSKLD